MLAATHLELEHAGITERPQGALADAGFWNQQHMDDLAAQGITALIPPDAGNRTDQRPGWTGGRYSWMRQLLRTDIGSELYENAWSRSSPCSVTPNTTGSSPSSTGADAVQCAPSSDY